jgi:hypothetical protein
MRLTTAFICFVFFSAAFSCKPKNNDPCTYKECECIDTLAVSDSSNYFPFHDAAFVVAYEYAHSMQALDFELDSGNTFPAADIMRADTLSKEEIVQFEKVCMNRIEKCNKYTCVNGNDCMYDPHHCMVFYNGGGKPIAYIEHCFMCEDFRCWPNDGFGPKCGDFNDDVRYFYRSLGFPDSTLYLDHAPGYVPDTVDVWLGHYQ